jgi:hypothetical protein
VAVVLCGRDMGVMSVAGWVRCLLRCKGVDGGLMAVAKVQSMDAVCEEGVSKKRTDAR